MCGSIIDMRLTIYWIVHPVRLCTRDLLHTFILVYCLLQRVPPTYIRLFSKLVNDNSLTNETVPSTLCSPCSPPLRLAHASAGLKGNLLRCSFIVISCRNMLDLVKKRITHHAVKPKYKKKTNKDSSSSSCSSSSSSVESKKKDSKSKDKMKKKSFGKQAIVRPLPSTPPGAQTKICL